MIDACLLFAGQVQLDSVKRSNASQLGDGPKDGNVLRRVAKVTLDQATKEQKPVRPKHVPEKLDFKNHEKFEGKWSVRNTGRVVRRVTYINACAMFRRRSNCILLETGFRLYFGYTRRATERKKTHRLALEETYYKIRRNKQKKKDQQ